VDFRTCMAWCVSSTAAGLTVSPKKRGVAESPWPQLPPVQSQPSRRFGDDEGMSRRRHQPPRRTNPRSFSRTHIFCGWVSSPTSSMPLHAACGRGRRPRRMVRATDCGCPGPSDGRPGARRTRCAGHHIVEEAPTELARGTACLPAGRTASARRREPTRPETAAAPGRHGNHVGLWPG
jgi:hypothetical protein